VRKLRRPAGVRERVCCQYGAVHDGMAASTRREQWGEAQGAARGPPRGFLERTAWGLDPKGTQMTIVSFATAYCGHRN